MTADCRREDCTFAETGECLLSYEPSSCPERTTVDGEPRVDGQDRAHFPPSRACTLRDARSLMARRYLQIVGVLGEPNAGKTACLVSLYLLLARNRLRGFGFADSTTLRGFEEISRGARRWDRTHPPEELTHHTELTDDRSASFLHLRLVRTSDAGPAADLLMSDLPGEWTTELVAKERVDRLAFLKRADVVWIVIDGSKLRTAATRQLSRHRLDLLVGRLGKLLSDRKPPLIFVVTRRDQGALDDGSLTELHTVGSRSGFDAEVVEVASFAEPSADVVPGHGIEELLRKTTRSPEHKGLLWPDDIVEDALELPRIGLTRGAHTDGK